MEDTSEREDKKKRAVYEPPRIIESAEFEQLVLACAQADIFCEDPGPITSG
ncbi:MAG: hypothetical protein OXU20_01465 [Myxococcales bacterium]|nr:hypothetical protein [Myxococcales bacterium]MDD9971702.1 hypothetical protein [Myxococcales bacterium]